MILDFYYLKNKLLNIFQKSILIYFTPIFIKIYNLEKNPLSLKNIEAIRNFQSIIFFFLQTAGTTIFLMKKIRDIESKFNYWNETLKLKQRLKKKISNLPKGLKNFFLNIIKFFKPLKKYRLYNFWGWQKLEIFIFPLSFIRYFYISEYSSKFVTRVSRFFKKTFLIKPADLISISFLELNYLLSMNLTKVLWFYKKIWIQINLMNNII